MVRFSWATIRNNIVIGELMNSYPMQVLRHWIYLPYLAAMGMLGYLKRGIVTQKIIELNNLGIDRSVGVRFETISYANLQSSLMLAKNLGFDKFCDIECGLGRSLVVANECGFIDLY
jgi:hypothetical protein